jgi:hypothetical protein
MNEQNQLENQLRSWMPRRPSARLEEALFRPQLVAEAIDSGHFSWRHFAPLAAVFLLSLIIFSNRNLNSVYLSASAADSIIAAVALSNQTAASYVTSQDSCDRNRIPLERFETINPHHTYSAPIHPILFRTNSLLP